MVSRKVGDKVFVLGTTWRIAHIMQSCQTVQILLGLKIWSEMKKQRLSLVRLHPEAPTINAVMMKASSQGYPISLFMNESGEFYPLDEFFPKKYSKPLENAP